MRRSEIPDTIFIVRLMAHKLLKSPIFIFPTARTEQITFLAEKEAQRVLMSVFSAMLSGVSGSTYFLIL